MLFRSELEAAEQAAGTPGFCFGKTTGQFLLDPYDLTNTSKGYRSLAAFVHICDKAARILREEQKAEDVQPAE